MFFESKKLHLIIVTCHAIYIGKDYQEKNVMNKKNWFTDPHSRNPEGYISHIRAGIKLYRDEKKVEKETGIMPVLVFTGGFTRNKWLSTDLTPTYTSTTEIDSEAQIYEKLATNYCHFRERGSKKVLIENKARNSLENVIFGVSKFYIEYQQYPNKITLISFPHKKERFKLHFDATKQLDPQGMKSTTFVFKGITEISHDKEREHNNVEEFKIDPYGQGERLKNKALSRDPFDIFSKFGTGYDTVPCYKEYKKYMPQDNKTTIGKKPFSQGT